MRKQTLILASSSAFLATVALIPADVAAWSQQQPSAFTNVNHNNKNMNSRGGARYAPSKSGPSVGFVREADQLVPPVAPTSQPSPFQKDALSRLQAVAVSSPDYTSAAPEWSKQEQQQTSSSPSSSLKDFWGPVLSSALLITGNTFGAGSLVLPQLAAEPGLGPSIAIFGGAYLLNLFSGLTLANVAVTQYEESQQRGSESGAEVPSSFQEFVQTNLKSPELAVLISAVSFCVNSLVLAFDISRVGYLFESGAGMDPAVANTLWSAALLALTATQTQQNMSQAASMCVMALFASFGSLLLPGLASLTNPLADLWTPGLAAHDPSLFWNSVNDIAPVIVMSTIFQNIVPTIVKLQGYDRVKSFTAIVTGSFMPLAMYVAWCWACLGQGGIDLTSITMGGLAGNPLLTIFSLATLAGSSIGCSLSCASELDIFAKKLQEKVSLPMKQPQRQDKEQKKDNDGDKFQLISVLATVGLPLGLNFAFGEGGDLTGALHVAGCVGSPLLYGTIPALMAYKQMKEQEKASSPSSNMFGKAGVGAFGLAATSLFVGSLADYAQALIPTALPTAALAAAEVAQAVAV